MPQPMPWLTDDDLRALGRVSLEHDIDPEWLAIVMWSESGLRPGAIYGNALNTRPAPLSAGARGLIQFLPSTLASLFHMSDADIIDFPTWQFQGQLVYVSKFLTWAERIAKRSLQSQGMIYQAVFAPATLTDSSPSRVIVRRADNSRPNCSRGADETQADFMRRASYDCNRGLDENGDGLITVGDLDAHLDKLKREPIWPVFVTRLRSVTGIAPRKPWSYVAPPRVAGAAPEWFAPAFALGTIGLGAAAIVGVGVWKGAL